MFFEFFGCPWNSIGSIDFYGSFLNSLRFIGGL
jgi:hypothetical protein